jgi:hypothetical protein
MPTGRTELGQERPPAREFSGLSGLSARTILSRIAHNAARRSGLNQWSGKLSWGGLSVSTTLIPFQYQGEFPMRIPALAILTVVTVLAAAPGQAQTYNRKYPV